MQETSVQFLGQKFPWRRDRLPTPVFLGFPVVSDGKESACNVGDLGLISRLGRFPGKGKGYLLQYSGLENSTDCIVHGVAKSQTRLSDLHFFSLSCILVFQTECCYTINRLQYSITRTLNASGTKKITGLTLL